MESKKSNGSAMFLANGAPVRYGLILGTPLIIIRVSGVRVPPPLPNKPVLSFILSVSSFGRFDSSILRFDNFCTPSVHFGIPFGHDAAHISFKVSALCIVARHLDSLLSQGIRNGSFVETALPENHRDRVPESVQRQACPMRPAFSSLWRTAPMNARNPLSVQGRP